MNSPSFTEYSTFKAAFAGRQIDYSLDAYEVDDVSNPFRNITTAPSENHTIYKSYSSLQGDVDYVAFDGIAGKQYTISTLDLKNGADTTILILRSNLSHVGSNDNANGANYVDCIDNCPSNNSSALSSSYTFVAPSTETYYIEIKSSVLRPDSAGRYGSYTLKINQFP